MKIRRGNVKGPSTQHFFSTSMSVLPVINSRKPFQCACCRTIIKFGRISDAACDRIVAAHNAICAQERAEISVEEDALFARCQQSVEPVAIDGDISFDFLTRLNEAGFKVSKLIDGDYDDEETCRVMRTTIRKN